MKESRKIKVSGNRALENKKHLHSMIFEVRHKVFQLTYEVFFIVHPSHPL